MSRLSSTSRPNLHTPALNALKIGPNSWSDTQVYKLQNPTPARPNTCVLNETLTDISDGEISYQKQRNLQPTPTASQGAPMSSSNTGPRKKTKRKPGKSGILNYRPPMDTKSLELNMLVNSVKIRPRPPSGIISDFSCKQEQVRSSRISTGGHVSRGSPNDNFEVEEPQIVNIEAADLQPLSATARTFTMKIPKTASRQALTPSLVSLNTNQISWSISPRKPNHARSSNLPTHWKSPDFTPERYTDLQNKVEYKSSANFPNKPSIFIKGRKNLNLYRSKTEMFRTTYASFATMRAK